jgi:hypothetical protein
MVAVRQDKNTIALLERNSEGKDEGEKIDNFRSLVFQRRWSYMTSFLQSWRFFVSRHILQCLLQPEASEHCEVLLFLKKLRLFAFKTQLSTFSS